MDPSVASFGQVAMIIVLLAASCAVIIAVEVERIAEAQRFSAKLLAERAEPAALKRASSTSRETV